MPEDAFDRDALYQQGMQAFRLAQWPDAIAAFTTIQERDGSDAAIDGLIANAQLKLDIERATPVLVAPSRKRQRWVTPVIIAVIGVSLLIGGGTLLLRAPTPPVQAAVAQALLSMPLVVPTAMLPRSVLPTQPTTGTLQVTWANNTAPNRAQRVEIILDASGSMLGQINGQRKIDIAHSALNMLINQLPDSAEVALRTYGRRRSNDCQDTELVQPLRKLDRAALIASIGSIVPVPESRTPLAHSIQQTAEDLRAIDGKVTIVLVSDGDETCNGDPGLTAEQLHTAHPQISVSVIGFAVGPGEWRSRLQATATRGGGSYFDAANADQLAIALQQVVTNDCSIRASGSTELVRGLIGQRIELPSGSYSVTIDGVSNSLEGITVAGGETTVITIQEQPDGLVVYSAQPAGMK